MTRGFRVAAPASAGWNLTKTLLQTVVFWTVFLFVLPAGIAAAEASLGVPGFRPLPGLGVGLFVAFGFLGLTSGAVMAIQGAGTPFPMDAARRLVARGPYACVRNPMAIAGIGQGMAVGAFRGSFAVVAYALAGAVLWHLTVRPVEERELERRLGEPYRRYRATVRCWWPRWPG